MSQLQKVKKIALIMTSLTVMISGCSLYQKAVVPSFKKPERFKYTIQVKDPHLHYLWWKNFHDKTLNRLIKCALVQNNDYIIALKNIDIAITYVTQNESLLFPQVSATFNSSRNRSMSIFNTNNFVSSANPSIANNTGIGFGSFGRTFNLDQVFGTVSYQLDVWNQLRNAVKQSKANVASSIASADVIKLTLITGVTNTWFQIKALESNISNLKEQQKIAFDLLKLTESQYKGNLVDISVVDDAKNQIETIRINISNTEKQLEISVNMLAYLLGLTPEQFSMIPHQSLNPLHYADLIPPGLPSQMIANRPDIQSAYFQVLSNGYMEKQMLANFLPSFNLTGNYGYANTAFTNLFTPQNTFWNYGISVLQPIFDYKLRMSEYKRAQFQYDSAFLTYKKTVINAYQEVNNALLSYQKDNEALHAYEREVSNSQEKLRSANAQYQSGYNTYSNYLTNRLSYLQYVNSLISARLTLTQDIIQVYQTLGLGLCTPSQL